MSHQLLEICLAEPAFSLELQIGSCRLMGMPGDHEWTGLHPCFVPVATWQDAERVHRQGFIPELSNDLPAACYPGFSCRLRLDERVLIPDSLPADWSIHFCPTSAIQGLTVLSAGGISPDRVLVSDQNLTGNDSRRLAEGALLCSEARRLYRVGRISVSGADAQSAYRRGLEVLRTAGEIVSGVRVVSCPTCSRCTMDLIQLAERIWKRVSNINGSCTVAVMGCEVNGPGEAAHCDVGVAGGRGRGLLFRAGKPLRTLPPDELEDALIAEVEALTGERCLPREG